MRNFFKPKMHWNLTYVFSRFKQYLNHINNPENPWLTYQAISFLDSVLLKSDVMVEFGSGRSTLWFAKRVKKITSIEHDYYWFNQLKGRVGESFENVELRFLDHQFGEKSPYVQFINELENGSVDICLIDGKNRMDCLKYVLPKMRNGSLLVIDNAEEYFPCTDFSCPTSIMDFADKKSHDLFKEIADKRMYWTSDGISSTLICFF